jgi:hypothetical protein
MAKHFPGYQTLQNSNFLLIVGKALMLIEIVIHDYETLWKSW